MTTTGTTIRQDENGRYCLNDFHRAAGGEKKHQLANWLRNDQTKDLIEELSRTSDSSYQPVDIVNGGRSTGTYVVKELVYAYASWVSPAFNLKVIRAYDTLQTQGVAVAEHAAAELLLGNPGEQSSGESL